MRLSSALTIAMTVPAGQNADIASALMELVRSVETTLEDVSLSTDAVRAAAMEPAMAALLLSDAPLPVWAEEPFEGGAVGNLVYSDPQGRFHILAVVFPEGTSSGVHHHGCWGVIGYLRGGDEETRYTEQDGVPVEESRHVWHQGDITYLLPDGGSDEGCWHRVRNPGPGTGVSVHVLCRTPADHPHRYWDRTNERVLDFPFVEAAPNRWVARVVGLEP